MQVITDYLKHGRALVVDELRRLVGRRGPQYALMLDYPLRPAKALRPSLCMAACRALGGTEDAVRRSAIALELYHNAFLIHDDVEDGSLYRRGGPTLHRAHGMPIAVNVADGMLALALEPLLDNTRDLGLAAALEVLRCVATMARVTFEGQALELRWIRDNTWDFGDDYPAAYEEMVVGKTAHYSFVTPVTVAGIVARASAATRRLLACYGRDLGIAFQVVDDLLNLTEAGGAGYGKEACGDLWEGKRTLMLLHALHRCTADERSHAIRILGRDRPADDKPPVVAVIESLVTSGRLGEAEAQLLRAAIGPGRPYKSAKDVAWLYGLIERYGGIPFARRVAERYAMSARTALEGCAADLSPGEHRAFLWDLLDYVMERSR